MVNKKIEITDLKDMLIKLKKHMDQDLHIN